MKVVICDDQSLFTGALAAVLGTKGWTIVGLARDPAHAIAFVAREHVDVCLMDLSFPGGNSGIEGITSLRDAAPHTKVVVLTASGDPALIMRAVEAGADVVVFKDDDIDDIVETVEHVYHGTNKAEAARRPPPLVRARDADPLGRFLTNREYEALELLVRGVSGKELAREMGITYATARTHIQSILTKLGVHSRLEAIAFASEHNLCPPAHRSTSANQRSRRAAATPELPF